MIWNKLEEKEGIKIGDMIYGAYIIPPTGEFEVLELRVRAIAQREDLNEDYIVGVEKNDKHAYLFSFKELGKTFFIDRFECLMVVKQAQDEHKDDIISSEISYEEY